MGRPLFRLEDQFIGSVCFGFTDGDTAEFFASAIESGREVVEQSVREHMRKHPEMKRFADDTVVELYGGDFVVVMPDEVEDRLLGIEYGDGEERPQPVLRPGVQQAAGQAARLINRELDMP